MAAVTLTPAQAKVLAVLTTEPQPTPAIVAASGVSKARDVLVALRARGLADKKLNSCPVM